MVRVTPKTTLTITQNRHPLPLEPGSLSARRRLFHTRSVGSVS